MFRKTLTLLVLFLCFIASSEARAQNNPFKENHVWVPGVQFHMAYDGEQELFMVAPGLHFMAVGHNTGVALGGNIAYFSNQDYSMGTFETLVGYDVTPIDSDVHVILSSGLGVYGYGNSSREVVALSLPMRFHLSFSDRVVFYFGNRLYHDFWSHPFPFDFGIAGGF